MLVLEADATSIKSFASLCSVDREWKNHAAHQEKGCESILSSVVFRGALVHDVVAMRTLRCTTNAVPFCLVLTVPNRPRSFFHSGHEKKEPAWMTTVLPQVPGRQSHVGVEQHPFAPFTHYQHRCEFWDVWGRQSKATAWTQTRASLPMRLALQENWFLRRGGQRSSWWAALHEPPPLRN